MNTIFKSALVYIRTDSSVSLRNLFLVLTVLEIQNLLNQKTTRTVLKIQINDSHQFKN